MSPTTPSRSNPRRHLGGRGRLRDHRDGPAEHVAPDVRRGRHRGHRRGPARVEGRRRPGAQPRGQRDPVRPDLRRPRRHGVGCAAQDCGLLVASEPSERVSSTASRGRTATRSWTPVGCSTRAATPTSSSPSCAPTAGTAGPASPTWSPSALPSVRQVVEDCRAGVPSVIENLVYPLPGEDLTGRPRGRDRRGGAGAQRARHRPAEAGVPGLARRVPPARVGARPALGGAVRRRAVRPVHRGPAVAFDDGGASGFIAGRSVWRESLALAGAQRQEFLDTVARPRLEPCAPSPPTGPAPGPRPPAPNRGFLAINHQAPE